MTHNVVSPQVVDHDALYRSRAQALQIRSYFYGDATPPPTVRLEALAGNVATVPLPLAPHSTSIKFDDLAIYRVGEGVFGDQGRFLATLR